MSTSIPAAWAAALALSMSSCSVTPSASERSERELTGRSPLQYLQYTPNGHAPRSGWPLVLFLHGAGERGDDLALVDVHGPTKHIAEVPELRSCVLIAPQCPTEEWWKAEQLKQLIDRAMEGQPIDPTRVYVTGLSMGGYGTWDLLAHYPDFFAAAIPVCGGGELARLWPQFETGFELEDLKRATGVAVHAFHGAADSVIPVAESQLLVDALRAAGGQVEFTAYPGVEHDSWTRTYAQPELYAWLFAQRRRD